MPDVLAAVLILVGVAFAVTAGLGLQRFPDVFARMHSATKPATLGLVLVLAGAALRVEQAGDVAKILLVIVLQFITAPVGAHMVGRAAYRAGTELSPMTTIDELARDRRSGWEGEGAIKEVAPEGDSRLDGK
jgi:multicomponent Na+:H+ antiporter subunit G